MKKFCYSIAAKSKALCRKIENVFAGKRLPAVLASNRGDLATNTIGAIIVAVVIVGLLIAAVNLFFPTFFSDMFAEMQNNLNANW